MTVQLQKMKMLVGGDWKDSSTGARSSVIDPSSGEIIAEVPRASKQDAKSAVDAARAAFESPEWGGTGFGERGGNFTKHVGGGWGECGPRWRVGGAEGGATPRESKGEVSPGQPR